MKLTSKELQQLAGSVGAPPSSTQNHEDEEGDALRVLRATCDREGHQNVARWLIESGLHGEKALETVRVYVSACLSPKKREKFGMAEVMVIMERSGDHRLLMHLCERLGYLPPTVKTPEARLRELGGQIAALQHQMDDLVEEKERLKRGGGAPLRLKAPRAMQSRRHH